MSTAGVTTRERVQVARAWFLTYSWLYFLSQTLLGVPPGKEVSTAHQVINWGVLLVASVPLFVAARRRLGDALGLSAREANTPYLHVAIKVFLLTLATNGFVALDHHHGWWRTFHLVNGLALYAYALPTLVITVRRIAGEIRAAGTPSPASASR